ncbi:MAG: hypothetical protein ACQERK_05045 [Campylobacterota bacterium]
MVRQIVAVMLLGSALCAAQDFYVTYKMHSKNLAFYNETILISKAMVKQKGSVYKTLLFYSGLQSLEEVLRKQKGDIVNLLLREGATVTAADTATDAVGSTATTLQIYPKRIKVAFNNGFVKIGLLK